MVYTINMAKTDSKERIINYIQNNGEVTPHELNMHLNISPQAMYRHLKQLIQSGCIIKVGASPRVFYKILDESFDVGFIDNEKMTEATSKLTELNGMRDELNLLIGNSFSPREPAPSFCDVMDGE